MNRYGEEHGVALGLCRTRRHRRPSRCPGPPAAEKDLKMLANDRNAKEGLRLLAKKLMVKNKHG